jgi:hypothetical protein
MCRRFGTGSPVSHGMRHGIHRYTHSFFRLKTVRRHQIYARTADRRRPECTGFTPASVIAYAMRAARVRMCSRMHERGHSHTADTCALRYTINDERVCTAYMCPANVCLQEVPPKIAKVMRNGYNCTLQLYLSAVIHTSCSRVAMVSTS